jgi:hypothetical protein
MTMLAGRYGFADVSVRSLAGTLTVPGDDDVPSQHLLTARRAGPGDQRNTLSSCI